MKASALAAALAAAVLAPLSAEAQHSLKWEQPPNCVDGFNVASYWNTQTFPPVCLTVADDFPCNDPRPIAHLRWWGSFAGFQDSVPLPLEPPPPADFPPAFGISWHSYTHPEGSHSQPDQLMVNQQIAGYGWGYWCSHTAWNKPGHFEHEYYFECDLATPLPQVEGYYYFLNVVAMYTGPEPPIHPWGWKNSAFHWNDDAVLNESCADENWVELTWPPGHPLSPQSMDMAFELYVLTTPPPTPTPLTPTPTAYAPPTPPLPETPTPSETPTPVPPTPAETPTPPPTATPPPPTPSPIPTPAYAVIESGDYNGDGTSDAAVFRPSAALWSVRNLTRAYFGASSDLPASADYNGDGTSDLAVFRAAAGLWSVRNLTRIYLGSTGDFSVPGNYAGGGARAAVFRPAAGMWSIRDLTRAYFGGTADVPVPADYGADGLSDLAVFRPASGLWSVLGLTRLYLGSRGDQVAPADYGGDGAAEPAIFRSSSGMWSVRNLTRVFFGQASDQAVPADFLGAGRSEIAVFRAEDSLWSVRNVTRLYLGSTGDWPVTK